MHYCHGGSFPKVTSELISKRRFPKVSKLQQSILWSQSAYKDNHFSESFVDGPPWQTKCSAASWSALIVSVTE